MNNHYSDAEIEVPKLIVFDLDFTLWNADKTYCDQLRPPFYRYGDRVRDADGRHIQLYPDVSLIMGKLNNLDVTLAVASRTHEPGWALDLLCLLSIDHYFEHREIYPGGKLRHFTSLQDKTGLLFEKMVFFDDEMRNIKEVESLGVRAIHVKDGLDRKHIALYALIQYFG